MSATAKELNVKTPAQLAEMLEEVAHRRTCVADAERTEREARDVASEMRRALMDAEAEVRIALEGLGYKLAERGAR